MPRESYGGLSQGDRWGCALALSLGAITFLILAYVDALGDCPPDVVCKKGLWLYVVIPSISFSIVIFLLVRWLVNRR
jgi:hypothetical protein